MVSLKVQQVPDVPIREYIECILSERDKLYDERDRLYISKFSASETAVSAALASAEKAVNAAFLAQQTAMQTALTAQEKAVAAALAAAERAGTKAEIASDKRLDGLNELRDMATDQQATFIQRLEAMALINAITERLVAMQSAYDSKLESQRSSFEKSIEAKEARIMALERVISNFEGRILITGGSIGIFSVLVTIGLHFIK